VVPSGGEARGGGKAAESGSDDGDALFHARSLHPLVKQSTRLGLGSIRLGFDQACAARPVPGRFRASRFAVS